MPTLSTLRQYGTRVDIVGLDERDEVIGLKKLYHDTKNKVLYFQVVLRKQVYVYIGTLDYSKWQGQYINLEKPDEELRKKWYSKIDQNVYVSHNGIEINIVRKQIIEHRQKRDPLDEDEDECSLPFRAWPTEIEFNYQD